MTRDVRRLLNRSFTVLAYLAVAGIALSLVVVLLPMLWRGAGAVVFRGTVEFRRVQLDLFHRGDAEALAGESARFNETRRQVYEALDRFSRGIDTGRLEEQTRQVSREYSKQLRERDLPTAERLELVESAQATRDKLLAAYETADKAEALTLLQKVLDQEGAKRFAGTAAEEFFRLAREYREIARTIDLGRRAQYAKAVEEVEAEVGQLYGPRPGQPLPVMTKDQYGVTRWDQARLHLDRLLWAEEWVEGGQGQARTKVRVAREKQFEGTPLASWFATAQAQAEAALQPRWTFYWQYLIDDNGHTGHYFGGVGPEVLGTFLITLLTILFAFPVGVVAAGYLVECGGEGRLVSLIRMCVNTLAGVPSIVFGLFGLAFFMLYVQPALGLPPKASILAGSLTLAVLVLPLIIRASEEAIRAVPISYKEAALALGAGPFRAFVTATLPAALPGILTGVILSMSRAAGETAPILFTAAVAMGEVPDSLMKPTRTLSYGAYDLATGDRIGRLVPHNQYGMVAVLVGLVLVMNIAAILWRHRIARRLRGQ